MKQWKLRGTQTTTTRGIIPKNDADKTLILNLQGKAQSNSCVPNEGAFSTWWKG